MAMNTNGIHNNPLFNATRPEDNMLLWRENEAGLSVIMLMISINVIPDMHVLVPAVALPSSTSHCPQL